MKKRLLLGALLLAIVLILSGCKAPEPVEEVPTATIAPTETPTVPPVTPEPTVSPKPMEGPIEWPEADATMILIDPIDKPTNPPIVFEPYETFSSEFLGISFEIPAYWTDRQGDAPNSYTLVFSEPANDIRSNLGVPASVTVSVNILANTQTEEDAKRELDVFLTQFREEHPSLETSSQAQNTMVGETGAYVTFWIDVPVEGRETPEKMRGRCLMVPVDKRLYMVRYQCPVEFNSEYENVYRNIRKTFKEI